MILLRLLVVSVCICVCHSASCGSSGIPFRLEVSSSGHPVLGCASPSCFGAENGGQNVMHDSQFNAVSDGEDGFFRDGDLSKSRKRFSDAPSQVADCSTSFSSTSCPNPESWVGGIVENADGSLGVQCCKYDGLKFATEVGRPVVHSGEVYSGGEVIRDGRQTGFDLISNIKRIAADDGTVAYEATVSRMSCLPDPAEDSNSVDISPQEDITRILDKVGETQQVQGSDTDQVVQVGEAVVPVQSGGYYYPVAGGVPACFSSDTLVKTPSGEMTIDKLKIGDWVLTKEENTTTFTQVISFLHRLPDQEATFIRLETSDGDVLKITPLHFIFRTDCDREDFSVVMAYAEEIRVGDCLYTVTDEQPSAKTRVMNRSVVTEVGAYAPMTTSGDLVVSNIYASCHNVIRSNTLSHTFFYWIQTFERKIRALFSDVSLTNDDIELPLGTHFFFKVIEHVIPSTY